MSFRPVSLSRAGHSLCDLRAKELAVTVAKTVHRHLYGGFSHAQTDGQCLTQARFYRSGSASSIENLR